MKKHYVFVEAFTWVYIFFLANSYFIMNYHYDMINDYLNGDFNPKFDRATNIKDAKYVLAV